MTSCCTATESAPLSLSLRLPSGTLRANRFGSESGALTLCAHGLSANSRSFDPLGEALGTARRSVVAVDLRGRGWSDITASGTYGWANHARDVLAAADALGAERFDFVGHSMGAYIGMALAQQAPERVRRMVLIDAVGIPETLSMLPIMAAVQRLGAAHATADAYVSAVRRLGTVEPWTEYWERHYRYDLIDAPGGGGVRARTDAGAVLEDITYATKQDPRGMWPTHTVDTLLVRAARPLGQGFIVSTRDRDAFVRTAPRARAVDIDANHYGVVMHPDTATEIGRFLS